jgi:hypothetical protein
MSGHNHASAIMQAWEGKEPRYYKVRGLDGKYYIAKNFPSGQSVKGGLTEAEADAYLKLLKE